VAMEVGIR